MVRPSGGLKSSLHVDPSARIQFYCYSQKHNWETDCFNTRSGSQHLIIKTSYDGVVMTFEAIGHHTPECDIPFVSTSFEQTYVIGDELRINDGTRVRVFDVINPGGFIRLYYDELGNPEMPTGAINADAGETTRNLLHIEGDILYNGVHIGQSKKPTEINYDQPFIRVN